VVFINTAHVTVVGNSIQKTSGVDGVYDAGARSQQQVASGDFSVQFTVDAMSTRKIVGLNHDDIDYSEADIDFRFRTSGSSNTLYIEEQATLVNSSNTYAVGDVLKVAAEAGAVKYYKNGVLLYTSSVSPTYPLFADMGIETLGASITGLQICTPGGTGSTVTPTSTVTHALTPTTTLTNSRTATLTNTPAGTNTPTVTNTPTNTSAPAITSTVTQVAANTPTGTPTNTGVPANTPTNTPTPVPPTATPTNTPDTNAADFLLGVDPTSRSVTRPLTTTYTITLTSTNGFNGNVSLSVTGLPNKTSGSFSPNPAALTAGGTGSSTLTVSTQGNGPTGPFTLTITATAGAITHRQTVTLNLSR
jgi:hypothetical protein